MKRLIKLRIDEISAVDQPAQGPARAVILKRQTLSDGAPAAGSADPTQAATQAANGGSLENHMTPEEKAAIEKQAAEQKALIEKAAAEQKTQMEQFQKRAEAAEKLAAEQKAELETLQKRAQEAEAVAKRERLAKRASEELGNLPGEPTVKSALLEAVEGLPAETQKAVGEILKAANTAMSKAFQTNGSTGGGEPVSNDAEAKIMAIAKKLQTENPKLSDAVAYAKALKTKEGREAYAQHLSPKN